jgi:hypothetical protein
MIMNGRDILSKSNRWIPFVFFLAVSHQAISQKTTEVFIPLGKSPGVSGKMTIIGKVESIKPGTHSITVRQDDNTRTIIEIDKNTPIYLDKSDIGETNSSGRWEDIQPGRVIEVKYRGAIQQGALDWIKIQVK